MHSANRALVREHSGVGAHNRQRAVELVCGGGFEHGDGFRTLPVVTETSCAPACFLHDSTLGGAG
jgi:hypothetical protein